MSTALERFLRYTTFSTQSVEKTGKVPSSEGQMVFAKAVAKGCGRSSARQVKWTRRSNTGMAWPSVQAEFR